MPRRGRRQHPHPGVTMCEFCGHSGVCVVCGHDNGKAQRFRTEANNLDRRAAESAEDNPMYAEHCARRASHLRRLARDEDTYNNS